MVVFCSGSSSKEFEVSVESVGFFMRVEVCFGALVFCRI